MQTHSLDLESGSSQYASIADASQTGLDPSGDFTLEAWIKLESLPASSGYYFIACKGGISIAESDSTWQYGLWYDNDTARRLVFGVRQSGVGKYAVATVTLDVGVWYHVAGTFQGNTAVKIWLNGKEMASTVATAASVVNTGRPFGIGADQATTPALFFDGQIKDVRFFDDLRTAAEIAADAHTESVSNANLKGEWNLNNAYTDASGGGNTLTASGSPTFTTNIPWEDAPDISGSTYLETNLVAFYDMDETSGTREDSTANNLDLTDNNTVLSGTGKISNAADFEASNSEYLSKADAAALEISGDFSFAGWFNFETLPTGGGNITVANRDPDDNANRVWALRVFESGGAHLMGAYNSSGGGNATTTGNIQVNVGTLSTGTWYHMAWVFQTGVLYAYVNGVLMGQTSGLNTSMYTGGTAQLTIGAYDTGVSGFYDGLLDEVAIYGRALHYGDILDLYNDGSGLAFSASTSVSVSATVLTATLSTPAPSLSGGATVSPSVLTATFDAPDPAISGGANVAPNALTATFSIPAVNIITPDAQVDAGVLTATFSTPAPDVSGAANVEASVLTATFSMPASSVQIDASIAATVLTATFSTPAPTIDAISNITVSPSALVATFSIPAPTVTGEVNAIAVPSVLTATFSLPTPTVTAIMNVEVSASVLTATFSVQTPRRVGGVWTAQPRVNGDAEWTAQPRAV